MSKIFVRVAKEHELFFSNVAKDGESVRPHNFCFDPHLRLCLAQRALFV